MRAFYRFTMCAFLLVYVVAFAHQRLGLAQDSDLSFYETDANVASLPAGTLLKASKVQLPALYRAKGWRVLYTTRDFKGRPLVGSATVIVSDVKHDVPGGRKVVAWAHPTAGTNRKCAPSLQRNVLSTIPGINEFVTLGYAVVAPDYPGLGTIGPVGYLVGKGQAYSIFDAVRAAKQIKNESIGSELVLFGYSQGGHAVLSASLVAHSYAPEIKLQGAAAIAPPTDLHKLMLMDIGTIEGKILLSYTLQSWAVKYGLSLRALLSANAISTVLAINQLCTTSLESKLKLFRAQEHFGKDFLRADPSTLEGWSTVMSENSIQVLPIGPPILILQGDSDKIVKSQVTYNMVQSSCRRGANIKLQVLAGKGHGEALNAGKISAINWISERHSNQPAKSGCH